MIPKPTENDQTYNKESIIEKTYFSENLPSPLFAKEGEFLPL
jgi:hypothetical protein